MLSPMQIKAARYDLEQIGVALMVDRPGQEALGEAGKALPRLSGILADVERLAPGIPGALDSVAMYFKHCGPTVGLFDDGQEREWWGQARGRARTAHRRLAAYVEGLQLAGLVCGLDHSAADKAAGLAG